MKNKFIFKVILLILVCLCGIVFLYNDDFIYSDDILKITKITDGDTSEYQNYIGIKEKHFNKYITGIITNGDKKGKELVFEYEETYSSVVADKFRVGDKVFIKNNDIDELKRDYYLGILISIFVIFIYIVGNYKGLLSIISVIINYIIFYFGLDLYFRGVNILFLCVIEIVLFSIISLFISNGINKKSLSGIISVIISIISLLVMLMIVVKFTNYSGINFNELKFLTVPPEVILVPELLIGSVGAIMDVAITISSAISELIDRDSSISVKSLRKSSKEIGKDIMSTMSNVLFFTYLCSGLPMYVLAIRNGFTVYNFISSNFSLELSRFLIGSISIIMTIPISTFVSIRVFKWGVSNE